MRITMGGWVSHRRCHGSDFLEYWTFYDMLQSGSQHNFCWLSCLSESSAFLTARPQVSQSRCSDLRKAESDHVWKFRCVICPPLPTTCKQGKGQYSTHTGGNPLPEAQGFSSSFWTSALLLSSQSRGLSHWKTIQKTPTINKKLLSKHSVCLTFWKKKIKKQKQTFTFIRRELQFVLQLSSL